MTNSSYYLALKIIIIIRNVDLIIEKIIFVGS